MLLPIAASNSHLAVSDSHEAGQAGARHTSAATAERAKALFFEGGGRPVSIDRGGYGGACRFRSKPREPFKADLRSAGGASTSAASDSKVIFSGRHEGLAFYLARVLRPIWRQRITYAGASPAQQMSNLPESILSAVQRDLIALRTFVEQYVRLA